MPDFGGLPGGPSSSDQRSLKIDYGFLHQIKSAPDAETRARTHHEYIFDEATGGEYHVRRRALDIGNERQEEARKALRETEKRLRGIDQWIDAPSSHGGEPDSDVPFSKWRLVDRVSTILAAGAATGLLGMGVANVTVNLLNSGNPVFIDAPWSAALFGALVPGVAIAAEGINHFIRSSELRRYYIFGMFGAGLTAAAAWILSFAQEFQGVSASIDWNALADGATSGGHGSSRMVWTQIVAETCLGAGLIMTIDQVSRKYWRGTRVQNAEAVELNERLTVQSTDFEREASRAGAADQAFAQINAARERFTGQALAALSAIRNS